MKIIIDECVPSIVRRELPDRDIVSVQQRGWSGVKNGELLRRVSAEFDVFITSDQNLKHQQNLTLLELAIIVLPTNQVPAVKVLLPDIDTVLSRIKVGELIEID